MDNFLAEQSQRQGGDNKRIDECSLPELCHVCGSYTGRDNLF